MVPKSSSSSQATVHGPTVHGRNPRLSWYRPAGFAIACVAVAWGCSKDSPTTKSGDGAVGGQGMSGAGARGGTGGSTSGGGTNAGGGTTSNGGTNAGGTTSDGGDGGSNGGSGGSNGGTGTGGDQGGTSGSRPTGGSGPLGGGGGSGATTMFEDNFDGSSLGADWVLMDRRGDASNNEAQCYQPVNAVLGNGMINLTAKVESTCSGFRYTSAMMQWRSRNFLYGTLRVRAKLAGGIGPWPAIWLLGADCQASNIMTADNVGTCSWPNPGSDEIDVAESMFSNRTSVNHQIHTASGAPGCTSMTTDVSTNFHEYGLIWSRGSVVWQIDGVTTCTITEHVPTTPMFLIINIAVGGVGGGTVDDASFPQTSTIDYVRLTP